MHFVFALILTVLCGSVHGASRSLSRSTQDGNVNLIEFVIDNVMYGRCTYPTQKGDYVTLLFEERESGMKAWSGDSRIDDPVTEARTCRSAAAKPSQSNTLANIRGETETELKNRIENFHGEIATNENYQSDIRSRFLGSLFGLRNLGNIFQPLQSQPLMQSLTPFQQQLQAMQTPVQAVQTPLQAVQASVQTAQAPVQTQASPAAVFPIRQSGIMQPTLSSGDQSVLSTIQNQPVPLLTLRDVADRLNTPMTNFFRTMGVPTQTVALNVPKVQLVRDGFNILAPSLSRWRVPYVRLSIPNQ